jgi:hypothetical protein
MKCYGVAGSELISLGFIQIVLGLRRVEIYFYTNTTPSPMPSLEQGVLLVFRSIAVSLALLDLLVLDRLVDFGIVFGEELLCLESSDTART